MLPTFPNAQKILDEEFHKRLFTAKAKVFPQHIHPPVQPIIEGKTQDFQREDRKIESWDIKKHEVTASFDASSGKGMTLELFKQKASELGEGMGKQMFQMVLETVEAAVAETGNKIQVTKGGLRKEDMLRLFGTGHHNFDEAGKPTGQFICGSEFYEEIMKHKEEWENDKKFLAQLDEVKIRKREEFNEREARRRLVE